MKRSGFSKRVKFIRRIRSYQLYPLVAFMGCAIMATFFGQISIVPETLTKHHVEIESLPSSIIQAPHFKSNPKGLVLTNFSKCIHSDEVFVAETPERFDAATLFRRPIPLLGTNVDYDLMEWTTRLVDGLDYPITHKIIAVGGCEKHLMSQLTSIRAKHPDITFLRAAHTMGVAPGWNRLLRYMERNADIPFAIIVNNDIFTPPGALERLSKELWALYDGDANLCLAHFRPCCFTSFVVTRRALQILGFFDENIYPAYWEDSDMYLRLDRAVEEGLCSPITELVSASLRHGDYDHYVSGNHVQRDKMRNGDVNEETREHGIMWSEKIQRGEAANPTYFREKWGCPADFNVDNWRRTCLNKRPFNRSHLSLSWWKLDKSRRQCIDGADLSCSYDISLLE